MKTYFLALALAVGASPAMADDMTPEVMRADLESTPLADFREMTDDDRSVLIWSFIRSEGVSQADFTQFYGCVMTIDWFPAQIAAWNVFNQCRYEALHDRPAFFEHPDILDVLSTQ